MRIGLDTSIVLRLLTGEPSDLAAAALARVQRHLAAGDSLLVSDLVAAESYFALQHHFGLTKVAALAALRALFDESGIAAAGAVAEIVRQPGLARAEPGFVDRMIHAGYLAVADRLLTFERAAAKLEKVQLLEG